MQIKQVTFTNFRKYEGTRTFSFEKGVHQVVGKNGAGKTSIFEALTYALYGQTFKKSANVINDNSHYMVVSADVSVSGKGIFVERNEFKNKKNKYTLRIDGDEVQFSKKADFDDKVMEALGVSYEVFVNTILVPQRGTSLLYSAPSVQRAIIEELFDFSWVDEAKANTAKELSRISGILQNISSKISDKSLEISRKENEVLVLEAPYEATVHALTATKQNLERTEASLRCRIADYVLINEPIKPDTVQEPDKPTMSAFEERMITLSRGIASKASNLTQKIEALRMSIKPCQKCGQSPDNDILDRYEQELNGLDMKLVSEAEKLKEKHDECMRAYDLQKIKYDKYMKDSSVYHNAFAVYQKQDLELKNLNDLLISTVQDVVAITFPEKPDTSELLRDIEEGKKELIILNSSLQSVELESKVYEFWNNSLSVKGVKEFAFTSCIEALNKHFQKFATRKSNLVYDSGKLHLDMESEREFGDLSGGEQQIIELALALSLHSLASSRFKTNLLILDEPFTNIDTEAAGTIKDMVSGISECVYIITHTPIDQYEVSVIDVENI